MMLLIYICILFVLIFSYGSIFSVLYMCFYQIIIFMVLKLFSIGKLEKLGEILLKLKNDKL